MVLRSMLALAAAASLPLVMVVGCNRTEQVGSTSTTGAEIDDPRAHDQGNTREDLAVVREVRQRLVADGALGIGAKNAVVIVQDGVVTLRGTVADEVEHDLVIQKVVSVPGVVRVDDRLTFTGARR